MDRWIRLYPVFAFPSNVVTSLAYTLILFTYCYTGVSAHDGEMTAVSDFRKGGMPVGVNF